MSSDLYCHDCLSTDIHSIPEYAELPRVTSDCKPWPDGGTLQVCRNCGLVQPQITEKWRSECGEIYGSYESNYQSGGVDQAVFDPTTGAASHRSARLLLEMKRRELLPDKGKIIDVGCGSGGFLRACSEYLEGWELFGLESAAKYEDEIRAIPGVKDFFPVGFGELEGDYSIITLLHVFEHLEKPSEAYKALSEHLQDEGAIFIQVPSFEENPFELVVADHSSHFSAAQLLRMVKALGGSLKHGDEVDWIPKEISLLSGAASIEKSIPPDSIDVEKIIHATTKQVDWLTVVLDEARALQRKGEHFAVFGTSIAANWLAGGIDLDSISYFVDEDPGRIGRSHFGKPIVSPSDVGTGENVFVPLAPAVAESVAGRLGSERFSLVLPEVSTG